MVSQLLLVVMIWLVVVSFKIRKINRDKIERNDVKDIVDAYLQKQVKTTHKSYSLETPDSQYISTQSSDKDFDIVEPKGPPIVESTTKPKSNEFKKKTGHIQKVFIENWVGILGSIILVAGIVFLGTYAALNVSPFFRFVIITSFSVILACLYFKFKAINKWKLLANWLASISAATFLFACLGASGLPYLAWIDNFYLAMALLLFGIIVNLIFAYSSASASFTSLHTILSLTTLALAPSSDLNFIIGTAISAFAIFLSYKHKWDMHLFVTIIAYALFHAYWYHQLHIPISKETHIIGIASAVIIGLLAAMVHYRKDYASKQFELLPFIVHIINWGVLGAILGVHSIGSVIKIPVLFCAAIICYFLAKGAKSRGIRWVYITDTLLAQLLFLVAIFSLSKLNFSYHAILMLAFIESLFFILVVAIEQEKFLKAVGSVLSHLIGISIIIYSLRCALICKTHELYPVALILLGGFFCLAVFFQLTHKKYGEEFDCINQYLLFVKNKKPFSGNGFLLCGFVFVLLAIFCLKGSSFLSGWQYYLLGIFALLTWLRYKTKSFSLGVGITVLLLISHAIAWFIPYMWNESIPMSIKILNGSLLYIVTLLFMVGSKFNASNKNDFILGVWLFGTHTLIFSYQILHLISPLIPGIFWLLLTPLILEISAMLLRYKQNYSNSIIKHIIFQGYIYWLAFIGDHVFSQLQNNDYFGPLQIKVVFEFLAIALAIYWWSFGVKYNRFKELVSYSALQPFFLELAIFFGILAILNSIENLYLPIMWLGLASLFLVMGKPSVYWRRLKFYSLLFIYAALVHVAANTSSMNVPYLEFYRQPWLIGLVALVFSFPLLYYYSKNNVLESIETPPVLAFVKKLSQGLVKNKNNWLFQPFFIATALFMYWRFDHAILTFLWVIEIFTIFTLAIILKENIFRIISFIALGIVLCRLVFYDMAQGGTLTRGMVFLGVGAIMLLMNIMWTHFRNRVVQK